MAQSADRLLINGVAPVGSSKTTPPTIDIQTTQDFLGIIYAPGHDLNLALQVMPSTGIDPIAALKAQIAAVNADIVSLQADYQQHISQPGAGNLKDALADQVKIAADQVQLATFTTQLQALLNNILPDTAPQMIDHASGYNGIYGSFVAHKITVGSKTHIHYDEALRQAGPVNHYSITNWYEDNASHAAN
jgi:hypothetical protein